MQSQTGGSPTPQGVTTGTDADASATADEVLLAPNAPFAVSPRPARRKMARPVWYTTLTAALIVGCGVTDAALLSNLIPNETQGNIPPQGMDMTAFLVLSTILFGLPVLVMLCGAVAFLRFRWARIVGGAMGVVVSGIYLLIFCLLASAIEEYLLVAGATTAYLLLFLAANLVLFVASLALLAIG